MFSWNRKLLLCVAKIWVDMSSFMFCISHFNCIIYTIFIYNILFHIVLLKAIHYFFFLTISILLENWKIGVWNHGSGVPTTLFGISYCKNMLKWTTTSETQKIHSTKCTPQSQPAQPHGTLLSPTVCMTVISLLLYLTIVETGVYS